MRCGSSLEMLFLLVAWLVDSYVGVVAVGGTGPV